MTAGGPINRSTITLVSRSLKRVIQCKPVHGIDGHVGGWESHESGEGPVEFHLHILAQILDSVLGMNRLSIVPFAQKATILQGYIVSLNWQSAKKAVGLQFATFCAYFYFAASRFICK